ncbi:uncharacterized protein LOC116263796 [Nymphaea colorata]|nr:uncharacterized protein LOC116263796 [Nymphaea colorata]
MLGVLRASLRSGGRRHLQPSSSFFLVEHFSADPHAHGHQSTAQEPSSSSEQEKHHEAAGGEKSKDEHTRVLQAALPYVVKLGWSEAAIISGARDVGLSPSIVGSFPRKEAALVEYFMDECLEKLIERIQLEKELSNLIISERIAKLIRIRLEMQAPYISKWPQALSIQAQPMNIPTSFKQRAVLVDEIWHAAGNEDSDIDWYVKRAGLGGVYSTTELYMLTDHSTDFRDTWRFLEARVKDAIDLRKSVQEVAYLAEAVGAGIGNSFQGFVKKVMNQ